METHQLLEENDKYQEEVKFEPSVRTCRLRRARHYSADRASGKIAEGNITSCPLGSLFIYDGPELCHRIMLVCCLAPLN